MKQVGADFYSGGTMFSKLLASLPTDIHGCLQYLQANTVTTFKQVKSPPSKSLPT
jgi:hypothetical protein